LRNGSLFTCEIHHLHAEDINNENNEVSSEVEPSTDITTQNKNIGRTILSAAFKIISYYSDYFYSRDPVVTYGKSRDTASSGEIHFNNKYDSGYGAAVDKEVEGVSGGHQIEMWANSGQLFWSGSIAVILRDPSGVKRINRSVGHNQYSWYEIPSWNTGRYLAEYVSDEKDTWNLWVGYYHFGDFHNECDSRGNCYIYDSYDIQGDNNIVTMENADGVKMKFEKIGDKRFLIPSKNHLQKKYSISKNDFLSFKDLHNQFYDTELNSYVDVAKNFKPGDLIKTYMSNFTPHPCMKIHHSFP
jgi:hypothetical protein